MAAKFIDMLKEEFDLDSIEINLMHMTLRRIEGADQPREKNFRAFLQRKYNSLESEQQRQGANLRH